MPLPAAYRLARQQGLIAMADMQVALRPGTVIIEGVSYEAACQPGKQQPTRAKEGGRWMLVQDLRVEIRRTLLTAPPKANVDVLYEGKAYRYLYCEGTDVGSPVWVLRCQRID